MPYAAVITGANHILEDLAPCFASAIAKIRKREGEWVLESASFEPCKSNEELYQTAKELVSQIHNLLALYLGLYNVPLSIRFFLRLTDDDKLIVRRHYATMTVNCSLSARQTFGPRTSGSLGTDVLSRAATDPVITEALSLVGHEAPTWGRIYDIIEFLGGPPTVGRSGLAPERTTRDVKQTANHYRHLGNPKNHPLPSNPPTLHEAGLFATDLLKKWIATRL